VNCAEEENRRKKVKKEIERKRDRERDSKGLPNGHKQWSLSLCSVCLSVFIYTAHRRLLNICIYVYTQSYKYTQVYYYVQIYMLCVRDHRRQMYIELTAGNRYLFCARRSDDQPVLRVGCSEKKRNYLRRKG